jgi:hypothetical protein
MNRNRWVRTEDRGRVLPHRPPLITATADLGTRDQRSDVQQRNGVRHATAASA